MNLTKYDWLLISSSLYSRAAALELEAAKDVDPKNQFLAHQQSQRLKFLAGRLGMQGENAFEHHRATMEASFGLYRLVNDTGTDKVWQSRKLWSKVWADIREVVGAVVCPSRTSSLVKRVLITVNGGVDDYVAEDGVDVELVDYDNEPDTEISLQFQDLVSDNPTSNHPRRYEVVHTTNGSSSFQVDGVNFGEACLRALNRLGWSMAAATNSVANETETALAWQ